MTTGVDRPMGEVPRRACASVAPKPLAEHGKETFNFSSLYTSLSLTPSLTPSLRSWTGNSHYGITTSCRCIDILAAPYLFSYFPRRIVLIFQHDGRLRLWRYRGGERGTQEAER